MNVLDDNSDACVPFSSSAFMAFLIKSCFFIGVGASCLKKVCKQILYTFLAMRTKFQLSVDDPLLNIYSKSFKIGRVSGRFS